MNLKHLDSKNNQVPEVTLITAFYGNDLKRIEATSRALDKLSLQDSYFELLFVELMFNNNEIFKDINKRFHGLRGRCRKINIYGNDLNRDLFQKECLYNIAAKQAKTNKLVFLDSDVATEDKKWLSKVCNKINFYDFVQVFSTVKDTEDPRIYYQSAVEQCIYNNNRGIENNPGIGWGTTKDVLKKLNGFNTSLIFGGGDSCLFEEITQDYTLKNYNEETRKFLIYSQNIRKTDHHFKIGYLDVVLKHYNHGPVSERKYCERHLLIEYVITQLYLGTSHFIKKDDNQLLAWKSSRNHLRYFIKHKVKFPPDKKSLFQYLSKLKNQYDKIFLSS